MRVLGFSRMSLNCSTSLCRGVIENYGQRFKQALGHFERAIEIKADYAEAFNGPPSPKAVEVRLDPARRRFA